MNDRPLAQIDLIDNSTSVELSSNRTSLSFERTRMGADRTLMATVRTSLSLIGFGFTIHSVFGKASALLPNIDRTGARLGLALLTLGILMLVMGIYGHATFGRALTRRRERLHELALIHHAVEYRATPTLVIAVLLLAAGLLALASVIFQMNS
jgi:putative membrane protein